MILAKKSRDLAFSGVGTAKVEREFFFLINFLARLKKTTLARLQNTGNVCSGLAARTGIRRFMSTSAL